MKRYDFHTCSGPEGSGAVWTEAESAQDGEWVRWQDVQVLLSENALYASDLWRVLGQPDGELSLSRMVAMAVARLDDLRERGRDE